MHLEQQRRNLTNFPLTSVPLDITSITANNNKIERIPNITAYKNLKRLALNNNEITEIDKTIKHLKNLSWLDLTRNKLKELPKEMEELNLLGFGLSENKFKEIPRCVLKMLKLQKFGFFSNYLIKIPVELFNLKEITKLDLSSNQLTEVPKEIVNLKKLTWLNLSNNKLKTIPNLSSLEYLEELGLGNNCLIELPFLTNRNLKILPVYRNKLRDIKISLENIKKLDFSENYIENPIIYAPKCNYLNLRNNKIKTFQIFIPKDCLVDLRENNLKQIPLKFYKLTKHGGLKFSENHFTVPKRKHTPNNLSLKRISLSKIHETSNLLNKTSTQNLINKNEYKSLINKLLEVLNCYTNNISESKQFAFKKSIYNFIYKVLEKNKNFLDVVFPEIELVKIFKEYVGRNNKELFRLAEMFITEINQNLINFKETVFCNKNLHKFIKKENIFIKPIISGDIAFKNHDSIFNTFLKEFDIQKSIENIYFLFDFCQKIPVEKNIDFLNELYGINSMGFLIENRINYCDNCESVFFGVEFKKNVPLLNSDSFCVFSIICCSYKCLISCTVSF